jgi:hypothetical protein
VFVDLRSVALFGRQGESPRNGSGRDGRLSEALYAMPSESAAIDVISEPVREMISKISGA